MLHFPVLSLGRTVRGPKCPFTTVETLIPWGGVAYAAALTRVDATSVVTAFATLTDFMADLLFKEPRRQAWPRTMSLAKLLEFLARSLSDLT
jgi:hypothetical protein